MEASVRISKWSPLTSQQYPCIRVSDSRSYMTITTGCLPRNLHRVNLVFVGEVVHFCPTPPMHRICCMSEKSQILSARAKGPS